MMPRSANRNSAILIDTELLDYSESLPEISTEAWKKPVERTTGTKIPVDTPQWFEWLHSAKRFAYRVLVGDFSLVFKTLTIRKEAKQRGGQYWAAYSKDKQGKLHKLYVGKTEELTLARLQQIAERMLSKLELSYPTDSEMPSVAKKRKESATSNKLPNKQLPITRKDFPTHGKPLTKKNRDALFVWCEAEYKRRYGRDWRFKGGKITRTPNGKFRVHYKPSFSLAIGAWTESPNRYWLEIELLGILNEAMDLKMTLK